MPFLTLLVLLAMLLAGCLFDISCITKCVTDPQIELIMFRQLEDFPGSSDNKESACNAGDPGLISGLGRSPGGGIGYSFQYSWASLVAQLQCGRPRINPWVGKIPWRRESLPTPVFWPGEFLGHGLYSSWGHKELDTTEPVLLSLSTKRQLLINFPLRWYEPALRKQKQPCCVAFVDLCHVNTPSMADFKDGCI